MIIHGQKANYADVKAEFESRGFTLLSETYEGALIPLDYICSCGNTSNIILSKVKAGQTCKACSMYRGGKYTLEQVRTLFEVNNCFLLSETYKDNDQVLDYICDCGEQSTIRLRSFMRGSRCIKCAPAKMGLGSITHGQTSIHSEFVLTNPQIISYQARSLTFKCTCGRLETLACNQNSINVAHLCRVCKLEHQLANKTRNSANYTEWRADVYARDDYTCAKCDLRGYDLTAHHIESWCTTEELRFEVDNGVTFCKPCHKDFHSLYGNKVSVVELKLFLGAD